MAAQLRTCKRLGADHEQKVMQADPGRVLKPGQDRRCQTAGLATN
ncbi:hypothetical protein ALO62_102118 [Pseudomonas amygdali pv. myricae]|uniref:Uncharacterized protein n=2 Tax=Pseudomonas amygdali TaxID=47877 RepID=A0A0P9PT99_PSEA0|nr:hypothetical protein ALO71_101789 [Pseudomonas amygdali pv. dendropanacis]KPX88046.1 hypothetical protein ALO62_102118 [Pseudomonas amygdali pv. myricae]RMM00071.1 hypothetical protein ALQ86_101916 [Pseudomonas amygdali pv. eriobotryae]RMO25351.1 hypothetical protein ALQ45_101587 [Pseudomonas amygdali pv. morsprunorum]RMP04945.1 hypothetical protein ALQ31_100408 [Pseudomonas amygdali pv. morsprunorum]